MECKQSVHSFFQLFPYEQEATRNKCLASSNKCLTSSNKKLLECLSFGRLDSVQELEDIEAIDTISYTGHECLVATVSTSRSKRTHD